MLHQSIDSLPLPDELKYVIQKNVYLGYKEELEKKWLPYRDIDDNVKGVIGNSVYKFIVDSTIDVLKERIVGVGRSWKKGFFRWKIIFQPSWFYFDGEGCNVVIDKSIGDLLPLATYDATNDSNSTMLTYIGYFEKETKYNIYANSINAPSMLASGLFFELG
jgi:hypothetical protein